MDGHRFDALTRAFEGGATRRRALAALIGLASGAGALTGANAANRTCRLVTQKCVRSTQCCSGYCEQRASVRRSQRNRCTCEAGRVACNETCCPAGDVCVDGQCCAAGEIVRDGICCPEGTTITCNGECCAEGELCFDGVCRVPCTLAAPANTFACAMSPELEERYFCNYPAQQITTANDCSSSADCRALVAVENPSFDCDAPNKACHCISYMNDEYGYKQCTYGDLILIDGACPA